MRTMAPRLRKAVLAGHITCSVGWVGAAAAYLALGISAAVSRQAPTVRAAWIAMDLIGWWVLVPLAVASLATGIAASLGSPWGLLRHHWVVFALGLTTVATGVLLLHMPAVSDTARLARSTDGPNLPALGGDVVHPALGLLLLLVITVLNVYKPRGLTSYGRRKQERSGTPTLQRPAARVP